VTHHPTEKVIFMGSPGIVAWAVDVNKAICICHKRLILRAYGQSFFKHHRLMQSILANKAVSESYAGDGHN
jgi:hypothetical protein